MAAASAFHVLTRCTEQALPAETEQATSFLGVAKRCSPASGRECRRGADDDSHGSPV